MSQIVPEYTSITMQITNPSAYHFLKWCRDGYGSEVNRDRERESLMDVILVKIATIATLVLKYHLQRQSYRYRIYANCARYALVNVWD